MALKATVANESVKYIVSQVKHSGLGNILN